MTTVDLLFSVAHSIATPNDKHTTTNSFIPNGVQLPCNSQGFDRIPTDGVNRTAASGHHLSRRPGIGQTLVPVSHLGTELFRRGLQPIE
jgi:hypothetical protein